jgi:Family of unknown function (DUF6065)
MADRICFYRAISEGLPIIKADRSAIGSLPTRAFRYCDAVTSTSGWGWYVFPPAELSFLWDGGSHVRWFFNKRAMGPLESVQFPGFADFFDEHAPEHIRGYSPPFLSLSSDSGLIQIWTGYLVRTAPGWSTNIRAPVNTPRQSGYDVYEGIIETDQWFGPLITNIRLSWVNRYVTIHADWPLLQIQLVSREDYLDRDQVQTRVLGPTPAQWTDDDWEAYYQTVVRPNQNPHRPHGAYAVACRQRRAAEARDLKT